MALGPRALGLIDSVASEDRPIYVAV